MPRAFRTLAASSASTCGTYSYRRRGRKLLPFPHRGRDRDHLRQDGHHQVRDGNHQVHRRVPRNQERHRGDRGRRCAAGRALWVLLHARRGGGALHPDLAWELWGDPCLGRKQKDYFPDGGYQDEPSPARKQKDCFLDEEFRGLLAPPRQNLVQQASLRRVPGVYLRRPVPEVPAARQAWGQASPLFSPREGQARRPLPQKLL